MESSTCEKESFNTNKEKIDQKKKLLIIAGMVDLPIQIL